MKIWRALNFLLLLSLAMGRSAQASPLTVNVSGTIDLSGFGASAASTFTGSVTWESTTPAGGSSISNSYTLGPDWPPLPFAVVSADLEEAERKSRQPRRRCRLRPPRHRQSEFCLDW